MAIFYQKILHQVQIKKYGGFAENVKALTWHP